MRRVVHLVLLLSIIVTVRACGGLTVLEDRARANMRWIAEKTGVVAVRERWRDNVAPRITGVRRNAWQRVEQATFTALERLASGTTSVGDKIDSGAAAAAATIKEAATGRPAQPGDAGSTPAPTRGSNAPDPSDAGAP